MPYYFCITCKGDSCFYYHNEHVSFTTYLSFTYFTVAEEIAFFNGRYPVGSTGNTKETKTENSYLVRKTRRANVIFSHFCRVGEFSQTPSNAALATDKKKTPSSPREQHSPGDHIVAFSLPHPLQVTLASALQASGVQLTSLGTAALDQGSPYVFYQRAISNGMVLRVRIFFTKNSKTSGPLCKVLETPVLISRKKYFSSRKSILEDGTRVSVFQHRPSFT